MSKKIIIIGMHRSGTSFLANCMSKAGISIGRELIGATPSNKYGHFEDLDFLEFHERLLKFNNTTMYHMNLEELQYNDYHLAKARSLVYLKDLLDDEWAFKQPRACLFLGIWRQILPDANYLIIVRHWYSVINSLYNRELNKLLMQSKTKEVAEFEKDKDKIRGQYLRMWITHNQKLLDHIKILTISSDVASTSEMNLGSEPIIKQDKKKYIVITFSSNIGEKLPAVIEYIRNQWCFKVRDVESNIFDEEIVTQKSNEDVQNVEFGLKPEDVLEANRILSEFKMYEFCF